MKWKKTGESLIVYLSGEMDHHAVKSLRGEIEGLIACQQVHQLVFDFSGVSFMDSSGVGMLIGRYKTMKETGGTVSARALRPEVKQIFMMSGLHRIINLEVERRDEA